MLWRQHWKKVNQYLDAHYERGCSKNTATVQHGPLAVPFLLVESTPPVRYIIWMHTGMVRRRWPDKGHCEGHRVIRSLIQRMPGPRSDEEQV